MSRPSLSALRARRTPPTEDGAPIGRPADPSVWMDRELASQLLEAIGAENDRRAVSRTIKAWLSMEREAYGDVALGEHLAAGLDRRERYVIIFRLLKGECRERTAEALGIPLDIVIDLEHNACLKAATLTNRYHENLICEPAVLSSAVGNRQREEAVAGHITSCPRCAPEFSARVANVLHHAARFITEREPLLSSVG